MYHVNLYLKFCMLEGFYFFSVNMIVGKNIKWEKLNEGEWSFKEYPLIILL